MKFTEIPYKRQSLEDASAELKALTARLENAPDAESAISAVYGQDKLLRSFSTQTSVAYIRHTINTADTFYDAEKSYYDEIEPQLGEYLQNFNIAIVKSKHRAALEAEFGGLYLQNIEMALKTFDPVIIEDKQRENKLSSDYVKLLASAKIDFDGKELTRSQLTFYKLSSDRAVRIKAFEADAGFLNAHKEELDDYYDQLVKNRTLQAKKLGFEDYIQLGYYQMQRNSYDRKEVAAFRDLVAEKIVPIASRLKAEQAARLGLKTLKFYDDDVLFPDGNANPKGTPEEIFAAGKQMYAELSPETEEFFNFMLERDLFDVLSRKDKAGGGYCTGLADFKAPFIFANFNGTTHDIEVLTHEAGHAFAGYSSFRNPDVKLYELGSPTYEACEVHSMSMEFFTWPWMENFFSDAKKFRYGHLAGSLSFIPYGCIVDEFQHIAYENPNLTPAERNRAYLELEKKYRPHIDFSGVPFFEEGRRWQIQHHIYERPFYYIDYCLAQTVALHFWSLAQNDRKAAWEKYKTFVSFAGTKTFTQLLSAAGLPSPFTAETFKSVSGAATAYLDGRENQV
ncbi:oligoendopeptidase F [Clostridia bacterium]|nr:oligoendopeptidase F [Clostridia bacterium]